MTKICRGCRDPKLHKDFSKSRAQTDGLQSHCKTCMKGYRVLKAAAYLKEASK